MLLDELRAAFPRVPLDAKGAFAWYSDAELCERAVTGKTWDEVDPRLIARSDVLAFLSLDRLVAWLPMYLHHLAVADPMGSGVWGLLMMKLTAPDPATAKPRKQRRFEQLANRLTPEQRRVVARTLQLVIERYPSWGDRPQQALDRYWDTFAPTRNFTHDPWLDELRAAFSPIAIANVFDDDDWQYAELYEYQRAIEGKTWEQLDPLFLIRHGDALDYLGERALLAVLPMHLHLLRVFAPTFATPAVLAALERVTLNDAQREVIARYRAGFA